MSKPSTVNPLSAGSLSILDHDRKVYPGAWIGMADDVEGAAPWLRVGGIADGGKARIALDADTRVSGNLGVGRAPEASLDVAADGRVRGTLQIDGNLGVGRSPEAALDVAADGRVRGSLQIDTKLGVGRSPEAALDVAADGRVRGSLQIDTKLGVGLAPEASLDVAADGRIRGSLRIDTRLGVGRDPHSVRPIATDGHEIHSGGYGAGYSFGDRAGAGDVETLDGSVAGSRWVLYSNGNTARLWTNANGDRLTVNNGGDMHVNGQLTAGKRSLFTMWSKEMAVQNKGRDQYATWKVEFRGVFKEVYGVYAFLGGFSLWQITDPGKFGTTTGVHANSSGAIPQHVFARVTDWSTESAVGNSYCSESDSGGEADNCVYFTVVAFGVPA
jgi:hypothetical protein